MTLKM